MTARPITVVTGPARSGTSCVTAMLAASGFELGTRVDVDLAPSPHNPLGHFESTVLLNINRKILAAADGRGSMLRVPSEGDVADAALRHAGYFELFIRHFDGDLVKDPVFCLTLPFWEASWPAIQDAVFCLRHPLAVARSTTARYPRIPLAAALDVWQLYTRRFLELPRRSTTHVFDFDAFQTRPRWWLGRLLERLGRPLPDLEKVLEAAWRPEHVHQEGDEALIGPVRDLYERLRAQAAEF